MEIDNDFAVFFARATSNVIIRDHDRLCDFFTAQCDFARVPQLSG
jgi:hypothetical protein